MTDIDAPRGYCFEDMPGFTVDSDRRAFRTALGRYPTGVAVVTAVRSDGYRLGITINSFASVSLDPPLVLWSINRQATSWRDFTAVERFAVNVLGDEQESLARRFALADGDRFETVDTEAGLGGVPLIRRALSVFECRREAVYPGGDHEIVLGRVQRFRTRPGQPLAFHEGDFLGLR